MSNYGWGILLSICMVVAIAVGCWVTQSAWPLWALALVPTPSN